MSAAFTSAEAYQEILENGLVNKLYKQIVRVMFHQSDVDKEMTTSEIAASLGIQRDSVSPRMPELMALGVMARGQRRQCRITAHNCQTWKLTGRGPQTPPVRYFMNCDHCKGAGRIEIFSIEGGKLSI